MGRKPPQVCWMLTAVSLKADAMAIVRCPDCMQKHGGMRFLWKGKAVVVKKKVYGFEGKQVPA